MKRVSFAAALCCAIALLVGAAGAQKTPAKPADVLEGALRVHPKFHYRYYLDGFGAGQSCALFAADKQLQALKPGTRLRVRGQLASKFFGSPDDKTPAVIQTWIIYMEVAEVEVLKQ